MKRQHVVSLLGSAAIVASIGMSRSLASNLLPMESTPANSTITASPTPFPTLSSSYTPAYYQPNDDQLDTFNQQFDAPNCSPPCLWGMTPGVSGLADVYRLFQTAGFLKNLDEGGVFMFGRHPEGELNSGGIGFNFASPDGLSTVTARVTYRLIDDVLVSSTLRAESPDRWQDVDTSPLRLSAVLAQLESVPEIYVTTIQRNGLRTYHVGMDFLFEREGILLQYLFDFSNEWQQQPAGSDIPLLSSSCPTITNTQRLEWHFWDTEKYASYEAVNTNMPHLDNDPTIDEVFGVSAATFVQYFRAHPNGCLESAVSETYYRE